MSYRKSTAKKRKLHSGRTPISSEPDQRLFELFEEERSEVRPVTNASLQAKATQTGSGLQLSEFKVSCG